VGKTPEGWALSYIILKPLQPEDEKPPSPQVGGLASRIYRLEPDGVTFSPAVTIYMLYKENEIPSGFGEGDLRIGYWDKGQGKWVVLEGCKVDVEKNAVTAPLSHFSYYAVLAVPPAPPVFSISALAISPAEVNVGERASISALISNNGETGGEYEAVLEIDGKPVESQKVNVAARSTKTVTFDAVLETAGTYSVKINGLSGTLRVIAPQGVGKITVGNIILSSSAVNVGQEVKVSAPVSNTGTAPITYRLGFRVNGTVVETREVSLAPGASTTISFSYKPAFAGTLKVDIEDRSASLEVKIPPSAASFSLGSLRASGEKVSTGDKVLISASVTNEGDLAGIYSAEFRVNGQVMETQTVPVEGHSSREVTFTFTPEKAGSYTVEINGKTLSIEVAGGIPGPWLVFGIVLAVCIATLTAMLVLRKSRQMYGYYTP